MNRSFLVLIVAGLAIVAYFYRPASTGLAPGPGRLPSPRSGEMRGFEGEVRPTPSGSQKANCMFRSPEGSDFLVKLTCYKKPADEALPGAAPEVTKSPATPHPATQSRALAMQKYPMLAKEGSELNVRFLAEYNALKTRNPQFLAQPDWPMKLAARTAYEVTVITVFVPGGEAVNVHLPTAVYDLSYASGHDWYGYQKLFGPNTVYGKSMMPLSVNPGGKTSVELLRIGGNPGSAPISATEF